MPDRDEVALRLATTFFDDVTRNLGEISRTQIVARMQVQLVEALGVSTIVTATAQDLLDLQLRASLLLEKSRSVIELLDDAERNQGGLIGRKTLTAVNALRLELSKWKDVK